MTVFTPTSKSEMIAGAGFWAVVWSLIFHIDELAKLCRVDQWVNSEEILTWINSHKALSLIISELVNMLTHKVETASGVSVMIGGTMFNTIMIFVFLPIRTLLFRRR
jgi:hypothetical protein